MNRRASVLQHFWRDTAGNATLEFITLFPFIVLIFFWFAEIGILTGRSALMKRGVDVAVRDVRLGNNPTASIDVFRDTICVNAILISSCYSDLKIDMSPINVSSATGVGQTVACENREEPDATPVTTYNRGTEGDVMLVKTCLIVDPVFPGSMLAAGLDFYGGGYAITVTSAFKIECSDTEKCN